VSFARASSLDRLLNCYGGEILETEELRTESTFIAADWGSMVHDWKETGEVKAFNGRTNLVPLFKKKLDVTGVRREQWWPTTMIHELAMAIKPGEAYAQLLDGGKEEKEAWKAAFDFQWGTGTLDGYDWMFDVLWIDDLKTGRFVTEEDYIEQRRFYALGLSRLLGYRGPVNVTLTHWPRYPVPSLPSRFGRVVEADELDDFEKRLRKLRDDISRAREDRGSLVLNPGESQCGFCPSRKRCEVAVERTWTHG
jgi:hypothetical protein